MDLKKALGEIELLAVFCVVMAVLSYFAGWLMALLWVVLAVLYQTGKAQGIKAGFKGLAASVVAPKMPPAGVAVG